jgi:hypothetical protein
VFLLRRDGHQHLTSQRSRWGLLHHLRDARGVDHLHPIQHVPPLFHQRGHDLCERVDAGVLLLRRTECRHTSRPQAKNPRVLMRNGSVSQLRMSTSFVSGGEAAVFSDARQVPTAQGGQVTML